MEIAILKERLSEYEVETDEFGRIVIKNFELMEYITGAAFELHHSDDNFACGSNLGCGNAGCANVAGCKK